MNSNPHTLGQFLNLPEPLQPWLGIAVMLGASRSVLAIVGEVTQRHRLSPEVARKALHLGMGTIFFTCPWLFDCAWPMVLLAGFFISLLIARTYFRALQHHVAGVIYGVDRTSRGEYYFPLAVAGLFAASREHPLLYLIPLSLLVHADAAAALIGTRYGSIRLPGLRDRKTLEGSVAFMLTAFIAAHLLLLHAGRVEAATSFAVALSIAVAGAAAESLCRNGLDNVAVPMVAFVILKLVG